MDNRIFTRPCKQEIYQAIKDVQAAGLETYDKRYIGYYLGVNVEHLQDGWVKISQPHIIKDSIYQVLLPPNIITIQTPELLMNIVRRNATSPKFNSCFQYHIAISKFKFLDNIMCTNIDYVTRQGAQLSKDPRAPHGAVVKKLIKCMGATKTNVLFWIPKMKLGSLCGFRF